MTDFAAFFREAHGHDPFPWQASLAERMHAGDPPEVIDVPTGLGKTAVIDIAVWLAATTGCAEGSLGRRRTFFVIDRRIVVDEAYQHALELEAALEEGRGACGEIARALQRLAGAGLDEPPLVVARMRGGATWDWRWLDRPDRAAVVVGTVDQLGSRLLFRAYKLRPEMAPIDAALVGTDSTVIIDEAHLSWSLRNTIEDLGALDQPESGRRVHTSPLVLPMSATLSKGARSVHSITKADREHPVARKRLHAAKSLQLVEVGGPGSSRPARTVDILAGLAGRYVNTDGITAVGVVCNTVGRARAVFEAVQEAAPAVEALLLTGRIRQWDRDRVQGLALKLAGAGRARFDEQPSVLVTTQTIEVGANLDFDALVTESAPWDALIQRFGRLNRFGRSEDARAIVVHDGQPLSLYAEARDATWSWLQTIEGASTTSATRTAPELDGTGPSISPASIRELADAVPAAATSRPRERPALLVTHLDAWVQTNPQPATDPPVAPFLHGYGEPHDEVSLVWRSDLEVPPKADAPIAEAWRDAIDTLPPSSDEQLAVPLSAFRQWARGQRDVAGQIGDVEKAVDTEVDGAADGSPRQLFALRWRGPDDSELLTLPDDVWRVRPDDLLVVPSGAGGCDSYGWAPRSSTPVPDLGDLAGRREPTLRLLPLGTLRQTIDVLADTDLRPRVADPPRVDLSGQEAALTAAWDTDDSSAAAETAAEIVRQLPTDERRRLLRGGEDLVGGAWRVTFGDRQVRQTGAIAWLPVRGSESHGMGADTGDDPGASSVGRRQVSLAVHQRHVERRARSIAKSLGLPDDLTDAVAIAAAWHDVGKLDQRFQAMLHGGDELAAEVAVGADGLPLAKSGMDGSDRARSRQARRASGLPRGFRHEVGSAVAVAEHVRTANATDVDGELVRHLVAAHHGRARPLFPPVDDEAPPFEIFWEGVATKHDPGASVDWTHPRRFRQLNRRYGRWGLALLETIVRLADIGCSEEGT